MEEGKTLFVSDLDGTLLDRQAQIPREAVPMLNELIEQGTLFSIATARASHTALKAIEGLQIRLPMVMVNGAYLYDGLQNRIIASNHMPRESAESIVEFALSSGVPPMIYTLDDADAQWVFYLPPRNKGQKSFVSKRLNAGDSRYRLIRGQEDIDEALEQRVINVGCIDMRERLDPIDEFLRSRREINVNYSQDLYVPDYWFLDIGSVDATKARGVQWLKDYTGAQRLAVYGDGVNDRLMFETADECYAVGDAHPILRDMATGSVAGAEELGVVRHILSRAGS